MDKGGEGLTELWGWTNEYKEREREREEEEEDSSPTSTISCAAVESPAVCALRP